MYSSGNKSIAIREIVEAWIESERSRSEVVS